MMEYVQEALARVQTVAVDNKIFAQSQFRVTQPNYISTAGFPRKNGLDNVRRREERERGGDRRASEM